MSSQHDLTGSSHDGAECPGDLSSQPDPETPDGSASRGSRAMRLPHVSCTEFELGNFPEAVAVA
ncbi:MAG: hypothetical protein OXU20_04985, partial [Myxococcales bacterium]|nr:hypothetical protein [Myxococcales bacterium]